MSGLGQHVKAILDNGKFDIHQTSMQDKPTIKSRLLNLLDSAIEADIEEMESLETAALTEVVIKDITSILETLKFREKINNIDI